MKDFIKNKLSESLVYNVLENMLGEDYPSSFNMDEFKGLKSFAARIRYCEQHLRRISSGSSRIVYMIDDDKVLKLAKNKKGLAQNEVEYEYSQYYDISDITAKVFDVDPNMLWIEMELAKKLKKSDFKRITGFNWGDFVKVMNNRSIDAGNSNGYKMPIEPDLLEAMMEDEFIYSMQTFIADYGIPVGDLIRPSSYGIVDRSGEDIVMIDYGLTSDVYNSYYS